MKANKVRMILVGMMAAGMALSAAPARAEETEVQTEAAAETENTVRRGSNSRRAGIGRDVSVWHVGDEHGIAPGMEPIPPNTAAVNALIPGIAPVYGVSVG